METIFWLLLIIPVIIVVGVLIYFLVKFLSKQTKEGKNGNTD